MKRFCIGLCFLLLFSTTLFAKKKPWKHNRRCVPCVPCAPVPPAPPCTCALLDVGTFWIGETHPVPSHPSLTCQNPVPVFLPGSGYTYGICQTGSCTGSNCLNTSRYRVEDADPVPIINEAIHYQSDPIFDSRYTLCKDIDPRFIKVMVTKPSGQKEIIVKLFTIKIDFNKIFVDYHSGRLPKGPADSLTWNYALDDPRIIFVGFEARDVPSSRIEPNPYQLKDPNNAREAIVLDPIEPTDPNKKTYAIVFLAP
ncbi:hypothetical protein [Gimesia aquarii]|uniref:Uncharacterized protein n=1 Tax=Gimesia aquarii TaxID=2527964 RepID=A0A517X314_9PLAN|nr:hypothetical protein [Gimesia aquarii]QDU11893.1 hypothetical protein V202x_53180 [Gimesia aquarii]